MGIKQQEEELFNRLDESMRVFLSFIEKPNLIYENYEKFMGVLVSAALAANAYFKFFGNQYSKEPQVKDKNDYTLAIFKELNILQIYYLLKVNNLSQISERAIKHYYVVSPSEKEEIYNYLILKVHQIKAKYKLIFELRGDRGKNLGLTN